MKTKFLSLLVTAMTLSTGVIRGAESKAMPACCAVQAAPAPDACCAAQMPAPAAAALSPRSIYQLEGKWTSDAGKGVELVQLRGRPVVVAMFFSSCTYACPLLVTDLQRVRDSLPAAAREAAQFVLVSFDTVRDTPAALNDFRKKLGLPESWTLLHGEMDSVQELAMLLGVKFKQDANGQFAHSNLITVLNAEGEVVHQRNGLMGDVSELSKAVTLAANP